MQFHLRYPFPLLRWAGRLKPRIFQKLCRMEHPQWRRKHVCFSAATSRRADQLPSQQELNKTVLRLAKTEGLWFYQKKISFKMFGHYHGQYC